VFYGSDNTLNNEQIMERQAYTGKLVVVQLTFSFNMLTTTVYFSFDVNALRMHTEEHLKSHTLSNCASAKKVCSLV